MRVSFLFVKATTNELELPVEIINGRIPGGSVPGEAAAGSPVQNFCALGGLRDGAVCECYISVYPEHVWSCIRIRPRDLQKKIRRRLVITVAQREALKRDCDRAALLYHIDRPRLTKLRELLVEPRWKRHGYRTFLPG
jgi:hypothetical protein